MKAFPSREIERDPNNPFKGLAIFVEGEELFERDGDVELMLNRFWSGRLTVMFAGSGVGKSSFLNAKLVPALRQLLGYESVRMPSSWARESPQRKLHELLRDIRDTGRVRETHVVILDQFEEVFQHFPNRELHGMCGPNVGFGRRAQVKRQRQHSGVLARTVVV